MQVYLTLYAGLSAISLLPRGRGTWATALFVGAGLVVFMGFRDHVGCDYTGYLSRYDYDSVHLTWGNLAERHEWGYAALTRVALDLGADYTQFLALASAILVVCYLIFARAHGDPLLILALLFPVIILQLGMSGLRQALAVGFLMVGSVSFVRAQRWQTAAWVVVAAQFHSSAIIFLPMAWIAGRDVSVARILAALIVLGPFAVWGMSARLDTYADRYGDLGSVTSGGAVFRYALVMIPVVAFPAFRANLRWSAPEIYPMLQLFALVCAALAPLVFVSTIGLHRLVFYVMPFSILIFVYLTRVAVIPGQQGLARALPLAAYGAYSALWFATSSHAHKCYIPYQWAL